jgi:hypothetical protein
MESRQHAEEYRTNWKSVYLGRPPSSDYLTAPIPTRGLDVNITSPGVIKVPASIVVTAAAFREFMCKNRLDEVIEGLLTGVNVKRIEELQQPAAQIREVIRSSPLPNQVYDSILEGCREMGYGATVVWPVTMPFELSLLMGVPAVPLFGSCRTRGDDGSHPELVGLTVRVQRHLLSRA